jgi:hypothetical protein
MKKFCCLLAAILLSGCAGLWTKDAGQPGTPNGKPAPAAAESGLEQLKAAQIAFEEKLAAAAGLKLEQLRRQWGQVRKSVSKRDLTVYHWAQTVTVTPPPDVVSPSVQAAGEQPAVAEPAGEKVFSCLAMFIIDNNGFVVDAASKGQCLDYRLMPAWRPVVTEAEPGGGGQAAPI